MHSLSDISRETFIAVDTTEPKKELPKNFREEFLLASIPDLKSKFLNFNEQELEKTFQDLSDIEWLKEIDLKKVTAIGVKLLCVLPPDVPDQLLHKFDLGLSGLGAPQPDENDMFLVFTHNNWVFKKIVLEENKRLGVQFNPQCYEEQIYLCELEFTYRANFKKVSSVLLKAPPLDHKTPMGEDVFDIVLKFGSLDELKELIKYYLSKKSVDSFIECKKGKQETFDRFLTDKGVADPKKWLEEVEAEQIEVNNFVTEYDFDFNQTVSFGFCKE